jgi:hypothetical protein
MLAAHYIEIQNQSMSPEQRQALNIEIAVLQDLIESFPVDGDGGTCPDIILEAENLLVREMLTQGL